MSRFMFINNFRRLKNIFVFLITLYPAIISAKENLSIDEYISCGCGCCVSDVTQQSTKCLYKEKGDSLEKIREEDKKVKNSEHCKLAGCSQPVLYKYCQSKK
ncbi:MAG: hypothetical protein M9962_07780 [Oligoflexia bacterium]|nr:hypothetical protein [Oligoflexia bacterium]